jgi:UDP-2-acetamido-3-amino-2,3-dideoxy-glucuronate N-acetyltransferase
MNKAHSIHSSALCESANIGNGTAVSAFSQIRATARIGENCIVFGNAFVDSDVVIGHRVSVQGGALVFSGTQLHDDVHVGPNVCIAYAPGIQTQPANTIVRSGADLGANAVVSHGITIGTQAKVLAGSVVTRSVPPYAIVSGNPAQIVGYVGATSSQPANNRLLLEERSGNVPAVSVHRLPEVEDMRGNLSVGEIGKDIPFNVKRYFLVYDVPNSEVRGEHAHKQCHQFLIAVKGSVRVVVDDGSSREEFTLNRRNLGLHLPPMTWGIQYGYSADAVLLVLASLHYDANDYIRDYEEFLATLADSTSSPSGVLV